MKAIIVSVLALLITLATAYYQRVSGPSYEKKVKTELNGKEYAFSMERSHVTTSSCEVRITVGDQPVEGLIFYKRYPTNDPWDTIVMQKVSGDLVALLPAQPQAGKLIYFAELKDGDKISRLEDETAIIRFRGEVPAWILIPHIFFMFAAMFLSNLAGMQAALRITRMRLYTMLTVIFLFIGGMILGPIMQKYAFGEFWTGFPFGWDLTDNKTLIAMIFWVIALLLNIKKARPAWVIVAAVITLVVYCIPHSMFGSELNYTTGSVSTG